VAKASRLRHRAKEQNRARERAARQQRDATQAAGASRQTQAAGAARQAPPAGRPSDADRLMALARQLASDAVNARVREDADTFERCAEQLADGPGTPGWQRIADQYLHAALLHEVTTGWRRGWQPAELIREVSRMADEWHARMAADLIGAELHRYAAATIDERWTAQLAELGVKLRPLEADYLEHWADRVGTDRATAVRHALEVLYILASLPELARLAPLPGEARSGSLAAGRAHPADQRVLGRVRALLAKAESTEFAAEAEALTGRAQELMARHSIDYAVLAAASGSAEPPSGRRVFLENPYEGPKAILLDLVAAANRCQAVWHKSLGLSTVLGFPSDLDGVELLFTSLLVQATTAMTQAGAQRDAHGRSRTRSFRQTFLSSYAQRIGERLAESTGAAQKQAAAESPGTDLVPVLAARDSAVDQAVDEMFPERTRHSVASGTDREGWLRGRATADLAPLHGRREVAGDRA
jgi:Protein of unknown function (DUF2786)